MAASSRRYRPGLNLIVFLLLVASLYGLMAAAKVWTPRLGLDLRGGTTITLTASNVSGSGSISSTSLEQARNIIQQRVDGLGVGEAEVTTQGDRNIVVSVPNMQRDELIRLVGQTAKLSFRNVYQVDVGGPLPTETDSTPGATPSSEPTDVPPGLPTAIITDGPPGLPTSPAPEETPRATTEPETPLSYQEAIDWTPSEKDLAEFQTWMCVDDFTMVSSEPFFACDSTGYKYLLGPEVIPGENVDNAGAGIPQGQFNWVVTLDFDDAGTQAFTANTTYLSTQTSPMNQFAIVLDGRVISAPSVSQVIPGGNAEISGSFNEQTANELANVLKYGALPLSFEISSVDNVSASLGGEQLRGAIIAGIIGLALVMIYSIAYYRALSIIVIASLAMAVAISYPVIVLLGEAVGFALNLPGLAGAILAIGVTADSFIIYFERIRDEVREGRSLKTAIETGWRKAKYTVLISDMVSLLSAVVLFILAVGSVRGFAFTLGVTTVIDVVIVFFFTKPLMTVLGRTKYFGQGGPFSGLSPRHMGVSRASLMGRRRKLTAKEA
ncbi:protein translocase subunit SecD [Propionibacteriaceae bacterium Y1923]